MAAYRAYFKPLVRVAGIGPLLTPTEMAQLPIASWGYELVMVDEMAVPDRSGGGISEKLESLVRLLHDRRRAVRGIFGVKDYTSVIAAVVAGRVGLPGPRVESIIRCQDKFVSREIQRVAVPKATPKSWVADRVLRAPPDAMSFPLFVKPRKSRLSYYSFSVKSLTALRRAVRGWEQLRQKDNEDYVHLLQCLTPAEIGAYSFENTLLAEECIAAPDQITVDGYCFRGQITLWGITRSNFLPGTISFDSFEFPDRHYSASFVKRIYAVVEKTVAAIGLDNTLFNVELKCDPRTGAIWIIEVNSRGSSQFMCLVWKVSGIHPFRIAMDIACGKKPAPIKFGAGKYKAATCFILRRKKDALLRRRPTPEQLEALARDVPDIMVNFFVQEGQRLSDVIQDSDTFRYAEVKIPGQSLEKIREVYAKLKPKLEKLFVFASR